MFHYSNIRQSSTPQPCYSYHNNIGSMDNNNDDFLLTSFFDPVTFLDLQQATYNTVPLPPSDVSTDNNDYYHQNTDNSDIVNEKHHDFQQLQVDSNNDETNWDEYDDAALIDMLLTAAATNNKDDPLFCMNTNMSTTLLSSSSSTASSIDGEDRRSLATSTSLPPPSMSEKPKRKRKSTSNARIGYCQHPKHMDYREENRNTLSCKLKSVSSPMETPRRGRPPKGTKAIDKKGVGEGYVWAMTVRPLPKRLEAVVGQRNIRVCLTCLKRSDLDQEYLVHPAYIGPQQQHMHHKRKNKE